jgi:two-component system, cell cycle response regulator
MASFLPALSFYAMQAVQVTFPGHAQSLHLPAEPLTPMGRSIVIVGDPNFQSTLLERLKHLVNYGLNFASSPQEAIPLIESQQPDVLIVQARQAGNLELCHQLKQQTNLAWIYCILINDPPQNQSEEILPEWNWELAYRTAALEGGADAYLTLPPPQKSGDLSSEAGLNLHNYLLQMQIQAGIERVQIYRNLMRTNDLLSAIALADPLTELSNRRALDWELPRQIQAARYRCAALSLLILDIDFFKSVNDTYGHVVGDRLLQLFATCLRQNLRSQDASFRYGGEEFVVILGKTNLQEAQLVANRLNALIANQAFGIDNNIALKITTSIGIASLQPGDDTNGFSLIERADRNLLQAKFSGRNRVVGGEND